ncbi:MAG: metallophosphoesterase [Nannocystaceae bacterium]
MNLRPLLLALTLPALALAAAGCAQPECTIPHYDTAECRVIAENELARADVDEVEVAFRDPQGVSPLPWDPLGLVLADADGRVRARVATLGDLRLALTSAATAPRTLSLDLDNVDPSATLRIGDAVVSAPSDPPRLRRSLTVDVAAGDSLELRATSPCPEIHHLAFVGDIQTNPLQFERILTRLGEDAIDLAAAGEPILGLVIVGDLTEWSYDHEFVRFREILDRAPVPVAVTAGNHDIFLTKQASYNLTLGPGNYAFTACRTRIALLDSGSAQIARSVEGRLGELFDRQGADFLIVGTHYPPFFGLSGDGWTREDQAQVILAEFALAQGDLIVAGHTHALIDHPEVRVGSARVREIVVGTGGADQGLGVARFGYLRLRVADRLEPCFVEVPPPGFAGPAHEPLSAALPYCDGGS